MTALPARPIRTLLVANRGEIAVRIMRTARRMGMSTVAIYSDADANALHVAVADKALRIGAPSAAGSYLDIDAVLAAARDGGADAVHPGYGFLSENADFAEGCGDAGLVFVGPSPAAMRAMGSKAAARALMRSAGVPVVPGYDGDDQAVATLGSAAAEIGFPVIIKASAGGGGRGLRVVPSADQFQEALSSARREAAGGFGDDRMIIEKHIPSARHVEVQVFGDQHGNIVHLFDRDCSIQRRHQKILEEAPAPGLAHEVRRALQDAAVAAAQAVAYVGAGTVEFLVSDDQFFFMEMNTRLQVEHPVTEAVTGVDLVEWQLMAAAGRPLPVAQAELAVSGHAVEARLCAEDPDAGFLPQTGRLDHLRLPPAEAGIRVDTGLVEGDLVLPHYDSLMAKIIAHGRDRDEAIARLERALDETEVAGVATNRPFLSRIVASEPFRSGDLDTRFLERFPVTGAGQALPEEAAMALAALVAETVSARLERGEVDPSDPFSPWASNGGWRLEGAGTSVLDLSFSAGQQTVRVTRRGGDVEIDLGGSRRLSLAAARVGEESATARLGPLALRARFAVSDRVVTLFVNGSEHRFEILDPRRGPPPARAAAGSLASPMPGTVIAVQARVGETVEEGATLAIVEAMKMEHAVKAPRRGTVAAVKVEVGDRVAAGAPLVVVEGTS
jgi:3-methylcrotonyl-CoA carboxylase alpha subunit